MGWALHTPSVSRSVRETTRQYKNPIALNIFHSKETLYILIFLKKTVKIVVFFLFPWIYWALEKSITRWLTAGTLQTFFSLSLFNGKNQSVWHSNLIFVKRNSAVRKKTHFLCRLFRVTSASMKIAAGCGGPLPDSVVRTHRAVGYPGFFRGEQTSAGHATSILSIFGQKARGL